MEIGLNEAKEKCNRLPSSYASMCCASAVRLCIGGCRLLRQGKVLEAKVRHKQCRKRQKEYQFCTFFSKLTLNLDIFPHLCASHPSPWEPCYLHEKKKVDVEWHFVYFLITVSSVHYLYCLCTLALKNCLLVIYIVILKVMTKHHSCKTMFMNFLEACNIAACIVLATLSKAPCWGRTPNVHCASAEHIHILVRPVVQAPCPSHIYHPIWSNINILEMWV